MRFPSLIKLNSKGISHVIVPLLVVVGIGVVGSFAMVSSKAAEKKQDVIESSKPAAAKETKKTSYLVVYSTDKDGVEKGYDQVRIKAVNVDTKTHKCGGAFDSNNTVVKKLVATRATKQQIASGATIVKTPTKIKCSAVGGGEAKYQVTFGTKAKGFTGDTITVDTDAGYCNIIRTGTPGSVKRLLKGSTCPTEGSENVLAKIPASVTLPNTGSGEFTKNGRVSGYAVIRETDPSFEATRILCTGSAKVEILGGNDQAIKTANIPITFRGNTDADKGHDRCVISLKGLGKVDTSKLDAGLANIRVTVDASPYYSPPVVRQLITF